jgi:hypothetical protein
MKHCPQCKSTFSDDNIFCLEDGTPLQHYAEPANRSLSGDMPTVVLPNASQKVDSEAPVQHHGIGLYLVVVILAFLVVIMGFFLFYKFSPGNGKPVADNTAVAANKENNKEARSPGPPATPASTPALSNAKPPVQPPIQTPVYLPAQSRVRFGKGKLSANVAGLIPAGANRSLVLACRSGQYLSSSISSPGGCVSFTGGGANTDTYTVSGDNFLYIKNNCGTDGSFNMTIFIK